jgi:hypothetical protein
MPKRRQQKMERIKKIWLQKMALESCSLEARKTKKGF